jgi:hypothetical protein
MPSVRVLDESRKNVPLTERPKVRIRGDILSRIVVAQCPEVSIEQTASLHDQKDFARIERTVKESAPCL